MYRHRLDPISLVAGLLLLALGIPSLFGGLDLVAIRWEWAAPLLAIAAGGALLLSGLRNRSQSQEHPTTFEDTPPWTSEPPSMTTDQDRPQAGGPAQPL